MTKFGEVRDLEPMLKQFLLSDVIHPLAVKERFVALIWWYHEHEQTPVGFSQLCEDVSLAGYSAVNVSRERMKLRSDKRTSSRDEGRSYSLQPSAIPELSATYQKLLAKPQLSFSDSILPPAEFQDTRGYIQKVIQQINLSYDYGLFDCCTVMIRRLLETLIIEAFEKLRRASEIKGADGHFMMFSGLLAVLEAHSDINIGRQTMRALKSFKEIADSSAHNKRFNASQSHIDMKLDGLRLAIVELRILAFDK